MNSTNQTPSAFTSQQTVSSTKKRRIIRKPQKCRLFQKFFRRGYSFSKVQNGSRLQFQQNDVKACFGKDYPLLPSIYADWVEPSPSVLKQSISSFIQQFPTLPSIEELFSLTSQISIEPHVDFEYLLRYAKTCSLLDYSQFHPMLLLGESQAAVTIVKKQQASQSSSIIGMLLTKCEASLCERRSVFMEKLRENESKYDNSIGRMSEISKQLAFSYRIYLETRNQISTTLNHFLAKSPRIQVQLQQTTSCYARILINKNLMHAFTDSQLDQLNYYKFRQYIEADRAQEFQSFSSVQQFQNFMLKRKPKRGRKHTLATACSVCLSDYHELNNPLKICQGCGLRAHRICYPFQQKKCGYCAYQKLEKHVKQQAEWCVICRKAGLMVIKIDELHYAHGFCLLVHGLWGIKAEANFSNHEVSNPNLVSSAQQKHSYEFGNFNQSMEIEFDNPKVHRSILFQANNYTPQHNHLQEDQYFDVLQHSLPNSNNYQKLNSEISQKQLEKNTIQKNCSICGLSIIENLFLTCRCCGKDYHSLCAFLAGFKMTIQENYRKGVNQNLPLLDCCSSDYCKAGWSRRFKLNYQKCAFEINKDEYALPVQPQFQIDDAQPLTKVII